MDNDENYNNESLLSALPSMLSLTEEQQLALAILDDNTSSNHNTNTNNNNSNSNKRRRRRQQYISKVLPKIHYSFWTLPTNLWEDIKHILPRCYRESFQATRNMIIDDFCSKVDTTTTMTQKKEQQQYSEQDILWAFSMVRSRSIAVPELQQNNNNNNDSSSSTIMLPPLALIPGLDLFNHKFGSGTRLQLDNNNNKKKWTLTSTESYSAGDQIFLSYGDDKDNWKLLLTYGFVVKGNTNRSVFWTWQDLLNAAGIVRPSVFPNRVQNQLLNHPQLYDVYTKLTENRASFSYDALDKVPRESLSNGLLMLSNLATQLGYDNDTNLSRDVLEELVKSRLDELSDARNKLYDKVGKEDIPSEWIPFVESILTALEEEERNLKS